MSTFATLAVNDKYPFDLPPNDGAVPDFLRPHGNRLLISMPDISNQESQALRRGTMQCGLLAGNGAILLIWQFQDEAEPALTIDSPFDARAIPDIQLHDISNDTARLIIDIHVVDSASRKIRGLREITMPHALTVEFLSAVQDQLASPDNGVQQQQQWMLQEPESLAAQTTMHGMGKPD